MDSSGSWGNMLGTLDSRSGPPEIDNSGPDASNQGERAELPDGVPVATRATCPQPLLDEGVREARATDPVRVDEIGVPTCHANDLRSGVDDLQRLHLSATRRVLQEHDDQTAGIAVGFLAKGVVGDDRPPFRGGAAKDVRF